MIKLIKISLFFAISLILACTPAEQQETVVVETKGIEQFPRIEVENDGRLGEFLIDSDTKFTDLKITNNSKYEIFDLSLNFVHSFESNANMDYVLNEFDEAIYPGNGGTCSTKLGAAESCIIRLYFTPDRRGEFYQDIILRYKNLIDEIKVNVKYQAVVGEYATLNFDGENSIFSFGVLDKAKIIEDDHIVEIINNGGLSAFDASFVIQNSIRLIDKEGNENTSEIDTGFFIKEHNCPKRIRPNQRCRLIINYSNSNLLQDDPGLFYDAVLKINYSRNSEGVQGSLTANFGFTSSAIEASLIFTGITNKLSYSQIITGTKSSPKIITVQNDGYKEGIIKAFNFYDKGNRLIAKCNGVNVENKQLICKNISGVEVKLAELPFKIYDQNNIPCIGRNILPKAKNIPGEKCFFNLIYWPSTKFENVSSDRVNEVYLTLEYDSRLGGFENLKNIPISNISYQFKKPALLKIISLSGENINYPAALGYESQDNLILPKFGKFNHETDQFFDIGGKTLVNTKDIGVRYILKIKNVGGETATIKKVTDSQYFFGKNGFELPLAQDNETNSLDIQSLSDVGKITFFKDTKTTCKKFLAVNSFCEISFFLNLEKVYDNSDENKKLLFDHLGDLLLNTKDLPFKQFNFFYENGSLFNDDGTPFAEKRTIGRITSSIISKGILQFSNMNQWGNLRKFSFLNKNIDPVYGNESFFDIYLTNVGTNEISYMYFGNGGNLNRTKQSTCSFFNIIDIPNGGHNSAVLLKSDYGGNQDIHPSYDCYDIIDHLKFGFKESSGASIDQISPLSSETNRRGSLKEGESCVLRIQIKPNLSDLSCFGPVVFDETNFLQQAGDDFGIVNLNFNENFLKSSFSSNDEFIGNNIDDLKFLPPLKKYFWKESPIVYYFDGDQNAIIDVENKILEDNRIYGEEQTLTSSKNGEDFELMMTYGEKGNIYIKDIFPMVNTLLMRSSYGAKGLNESEDFDFVYPASYFLNSQMVRTGEYGNQLIKIANENISFHRNSGLYRIADWKIFLGGYPNNDSTEHRFNFTLNFSGSRESKVIRCKIETNDGFFVPNHSSGILPGQRFYDALMAFGCSLNPGPINKSIVEIENLTSENTDGFLLKFLPFSINNYFFKLTFTIQDLLNPENLPSLPTRDIVFDFSASSLASSTQNVCFSQSNSCQNGGNDIINFSNSNRMNSYFELRAAKGEISHQYIEIFNGNNFSISPIILFKNENSKIFLDKLPNSINIEIPQNCYNNLGKVEILSGESCLLDISFLPNELSVNSEFDLVIGYENINPEDYEGNTQRIFKEIPIKTKLLINGEIRPFKVVKNILNNGEIVDTEVCSNEPLPMSTISYTRNSTNYEIKSINLDIGENLYSDISNGIYQNFCIKNFESLPLLFWDSNLNWVPETVNEIDNLVKVYSSTSGNINLYLKEHCLIKSMEETPTGKRQKDSPTGYDSYGINNGEECLGMIYFKPNPSQINNYINSSFGLLDYFSNTPIDSAPPTLLMGVSIKGRINPPPAQANLSNNDIERSIYEIETTNNSAEISWNDFSYDNLFGEITTYLVFVDQGFTLLQSDDQIKNRALNPELPNCTIPRNPLITTYSCLVNNLNSSSRYYVRVVPVVEYLGDKFIAFDKNKKNIFSFYTIPNSVNYSYSYLENIFLEKSLASESADLTLEDAQNICKDKLDLEILLNSNSSQDIAHTQISLREWKIILSDIEKYNLDSNMIRNFIWINGVVANDFGGANLDDNSNSYNLSLENNFYYQFMWSGNRVPDRFNIATAELPSDLSEIPEYGSLFLTDSDGYYFNSRCFVQLPP